MIVYLGADHRGFEHKEHLKRYLTERGHDVVDKGAVSYEQDDDYPDFAHAVARAVAGAEGDARGIVLCGSGIGMDIVANKVPGIRATIGYSRDAAIHARESDDVNVLALAADVVDADEAIAITEAFLTTSFSGAERHERRIKKITDIEQEHRATAS